MSTYVNLLYVKICVCVSCHTNRVLSTPHVSGSEKFTCRVWGLVCCEPRCITLCTWQSRVGFWENICILYHQFGTWLLFPLSVHTPTSKRKQIYVCTTSMNLEHWSYKHPSQCRSGILFLFLFPRKKTRSEGKKCHTKTMMSSKSYEMLK